MANIIEVDQNSNISYIPPESSDNFMVPTDAGVIVLLTDKQKEDHRIPHTVIKGKPEELKDIWFVLTMFLKDKGILSNEFIIKYTARFCGILDEVIQDQKG
jgi:hypothetical protein